MVAEAIFGDGFFHISRIGKYRIVYIDRAGYMAFGSLLQQRTVAGVSSCLFPLLHETLQNPEACNVLKELDFSSGAAFVGKSCLACFFAQDRFIQFHTQQRPGS